MDALDIRNIFILGISPRSGTNFFHKLLLLHSNCCVSKIKGEDFIIYNSETLMRFAKQVLQKNQKWGNTIDELRNGLEEGIYKYIKNTSSDINCITVTKTPLPVGIENFITLFPNSVVVIIIRNGPDTVESFVRTFGGRYDDAIRTWARGANDILAFINNNELSDKRYYLVKYEDLYLNTKQEMRKILDLCKLDHDLYDFDQAENLGVVGSSTYKKDENVMWDYMLDKDSSFNPINRAKNWSNIRHKRFQWMAGKYSKKLGYSPYCAGWSITDYVNNFFLHIYDMGYRIIRRVYLNVNHLLLKYL